MNNILNKKKSHNLVLFIIIISFFMLPRLIGGVRLEELITIIYTMFLLPSFIFICIKKRLIPVILYFIFLLFSFFLCLYSDILYSNIQGFNWIYFSKYFLFFSFICLGYYSGKFNSFDNKNIQRIIYICLGLNFIWMLYQVVSGKLGSLFGADRAFSYGLALIGEAAAFQVGSLLSLIFFIGLSFFYEKNNLIFKFFGFLFTLFLFYSIYLTQSRVNLLAILVGLIIYFFIKVKIIYKYIILSSFIVGLIYVFSILNFSFSKNDNNRFTLDGILTSYDARGSEIWSEPISIISENIFIGHGLGALSSFNENTNEMHNYYFKLLLEGGLFYFIIFILFIISIFFLKNNQSKYIFSMKLYLLCLVLSGFLQDSFSSDKAVIPIFFLLGYFLYTSDIKGEKNG